MQSGALSGVVVIEAAQSIGAAYCGKLLADLGATVTLVERPTGHPLRTSGASRPGSAYSGLFAHLAANKESVVLSPDEPGHVEALRAAVLSADILITDGCLDLASVMSGLRPPTLIEVDLSPFGRTGPYRDWKSTEFTTWAMGGYMYFTGERSREPLALHGAQSDFHCGVQAALAALAALHEKRKSGFGQGIEVTALEAVLSAHSWLTVAWSHAGATIERTTHDFIRCRDGWVCFMRGIMYPSLFFMIERPDLLEDPRWQDLPGWSAHLADIYGMVAEWCVEKDRRDVVQAAQELRIACLPLNDAGDLDRSEQLNARNWWLELDDPELGNVRLPGFPYLFSETPPALRTPPPAVGQHTHPFITSAEAPGPPPIGAPPVLPALAGLRVVEVTSNWAGPVCGRHLGDLGADVIKVESPTRPATRGGFWPHMDPQRDGFNRAGYFNQMNRNKRDLVLDLADAEGRRVFLELVRTADVLIENNSARVMPNLGLGYETLSKLNPKLIMVSISGSGATGPERDFVAYGSTVEASSGLAALVGYDDSQAYRTNSYYADPVAGAHAAVATLAALEHRRRTGRGQWIDVSLNESTAAFFAESLIDYQVSGEIAHRNGNRLRHRCPQGAYRCAGLDNWIAISICTDDEWRALCRVMKRDDLDQPAFVTLDGRLTEADAIDDAISTWSAGREQREAVWELQSAGVAAAPVLANWQLLADPHLFERGFYVPIAHPVAGVYPYPGWPWKFSRTPAAVTRHAPLFGEHNDGILKELGLDGEQLRALYAAGVVTRTPAPP